MKGFVGFKYFGAVAVLASFLGAAASADDVVGNGSGGGGNALTSGQNWRVADSAYKAPKYTRFRIDGKLYETLTAISKTLQQADLGYLVRHDVPDTYPKQTFFTQEVFRRNVEYRLVEKLPANCRFVEDRNVNALPAEQNVRAGCTFGSVTYLVDSVVKQAVANQNYLELALLIMHERLFPFTKHQESHELISEFIQGVRVLMLKYAPAYEKFLASLPENLDSPWVKTPPRIFDEEELEIVRRLPERVEQLTGVEFRYYSWFTPWGGKYRSDATLSSDSDPEGVILGMGAEVSHGEIKGKHIVVVNSNLTSTYLDGSEMRVVGSQTGGTALATSIQGRNVNLVHSTVQYLSANDVDGLTLDRTKWESYKSQQGLKNVTLRNSIVENTSICNNYWPEQKFVAGNGWLGGQLTEGKVLEWARLDANCKTSALPIPPFKTTASPIKH
jgi:hypothetical protein